MADTPIMCDAKLATEVLDLVCEIASEYSEPMEVCFEELSAEAGKLPRLMLALQSSSDQQSSYISGERIMPFPFTLTLRVANVDEQSRLDAAGALNAISDAFLTRCQVLDDYVAYRRPLASVVSCLGRTSEFEDWQVTFELKYKQINN